MIRRQRAAQELLFIIFIILLTFAALLFSGFFQVVSTVFQPRENLLAKLQGMQVYYWHTMDADGGKSEWVLLDEYNQVGRSFPLTVQFRALDDRAYGQPVVVDADWVVDEPERIDLQVNEDEKAILSILGPVQSRMEVTTNGSSKTFYIQAAYLDPLCSQVRVEISTEPQPDLPAQTCRVIYLPIIQKDAPAAFPEGGDLPAYP